jgi:hypothetical protein
MILQGIEIYDPTTIDIDYKISGETIGFPVAVTTDSSRREVYLLVPFQKSVSQSGTLKRAYSTINGREGSKFSPRDRTLDESVIMLLLSGNAKFVGSDYEATCVTASQSGFGLRLSLTPSYIDESGNGRTLLYQSSEINIAQFNPYDNSPYYFQILFIYRYIYGTYSYYDYVLKIILPSPFLNRSPVASQWIDLSVIRKVGMMACEHNIALNSISGVAYCPYVYGGFSFSATYTLTVLNSGTWNNGSILYFPLKKHIDVVNYLEENTINTTLETVKPLYTMIYDENYTNVVNGAMNISNDFLPVFNRTAEATFKIKPKYLID